MCLLYVRLGNFRDFLQISQTFTEPPPRLPYGRNIFVHYFFGREKFPGSQGLKLKSVFGLTYPTEFLNSVVYMITLNTVKNMNTVSIRFHRFGSIRKAW